MVGKGPCFWVGPLNRLDIKSLRELAVTNSAKKRPDRKTKRQIKYRSVTNARSPRGASRLWCSQPLRNRRLLRFVAQSLRSTKRRTSRYVFLAFIGVHGG